MKTTNYTDKSKYIVESLNRYITHSEIVFNSSRFKHTSGTAKKLDAVNRCKDRVKGINALHGSRIICVLVMAMRKDLEYILPDRANNSWESSLYNLQEILSLCKEELIRQKTIA